MEMEVGDDGAAGPSRQTLKSFYSKRDVQRAHSLHTGARQRCACIFLVIVDECMTLWIEPERVDM